MIMQRREVGVFHLNLKDQGRTKKKDINENDIFKNMAVILLLEIYDNN
jgi:hypothetical protein